MFQDAFGLGSWMLLRVPCLIQIVTCSCTTDDPAEAGKVCECMDFFEALSNFFVALYIM
eukprot:COSAG01_NODE_15823_length_1295_cov_10.209030_1_plen_59_part_00